MKAAARASRQERALQWRREHVLECAARVFGRKGFHATTMQEIAQEADYSTGNLYNLFESKETLFMALVARGMGQLVGALREQTARGGSPWEKIQLYLRAFFEFCEQRKDLFRIFLDRTGGSLAAFRGESDARIAEGRQEFRSLVEEILREGVRKGAFRKSVDTQIMAGSFFGVVTQIANDWITRTPERAAASLLPAAEELIGGLLGVDAESSARARAGRDAKRSTVQSRRASRAVRRAT